jgi:glycosyltransferase involved in cell wall biosynthesis
MSKSLPQKERIRVCLAAPSLDIYGGQARQAVRLMTAFQQEASLSVSFIPHNPRLPEPLRWLQQIKYVRTVVTTLQYWLLLVTQLWRYDVVHVFSASYFSYLLSAAPAILIGKLYGKKVILNYRSGEAEDHLQNWPLTAKPIMQLADRIVVPSGYLVDVFAKFGLSAEAIFNIVELDRFRFRDRAPLQPKFLCSRLLEPLYNVGNVIRAFQLIQQEYPEASLTIAADGWQRAELEQLATDLQTRNTEFRGFVAFEQMPDLYDEHDLYLIGNDIDNMPAAVTESCATGIALVTTNAGGIPYLVKHEESALIVNCGDYAALARAALRLLKDPELARRLAHNARRTAQLFTWENVRDQWLQLYRDLTNETKAAQRENRPTLPQRS